MSYHCMIAVYDVDVAAPIHQLDDVTWLANASIQVQNISMKEGFTNRLDVANRLLNQDKQMSHRFWKANN